MSVELVAGEDDEVGFLGGEYLGDEGAGGVVGVLAVEGLDVLAGAEGDGEVEVGDLEDFEAAGVGEVQWGSFGGGWRQVYYEV